MRTAQPEFRARRPVLAGRRAGAPPWPRIETDLVTRLKSVLCIIAVILVALSFPIQVYTMSPYPSLLPYAILGVIILLTMLPRSQGLKVKSTRASNSNIGLLVAIYVLLLVTTTAWQAAFELISESYAMNALAIYLLPVAWYLYFRRTGSESEIRAVLVATAVAGLIVGIYFSYDSYVKLGRGEITDYSLRAFNYSMSRVDMTMEEANSTRIRPNDRSFGLLQTHAVSGAWVVIGAFAALAVLPARRTIRSSAIIAFGTMVVLGLNFTAIVAYACLMFLFEFGGLSMVRGRRTEILKNIVPLVSVGALLSWVIFQVARGTMSEWIGYYFSAQTDFAMEGGENRGLILGWLDSIGAYLEHSFEYPATLLVGDGFSTWGLPKGGDTGFVESMARLGIVFYTIIVFGVLALVGAALRQVKAMSAQASPEPAVIDSRRVLRFAMCMTLLVLISDVHYSIWTAKSILPLVFFTLAMFERYLTMPRRISFLGF